MIKFPEEYIKTDYPGYFWSVSTKKLYSIKRGSLKAMTLSEQYQKYKDQWGITWKNGPYFFYAISVNGQKKSITLNQLKSLEREFRRRFTKMEIVDEYVRELFLA